MPVPDSFYDGLYGVSGAHPSKRGRTLWKRDASLGHVMTAAVLVVCVGLVALGLAIHNIVYLHAHFLVRKNDIPASGKIPDNPVKHFTSQEQARDIRVLTGRVQTSGVMDIVENSTGFADASFSVTLLKKADISNTDVWGTNVQFAGIKLNAPAELVSGFRAEDASATPNYCGGGTTFSHAMCGETEATSPVVLYVTETAPAGQVIQDANKSLRWSVFVRIVFVKK